MRRTVLAVTVLGLAFGSGFFASTGDSGFAPAVEAAGIPGSALAGVDLTEAVAPDTSPPPAEAYTATERPILPGNEEMPPYGAAGPQVVAFQQALVAAGYDPGPVDGRFGVLTAAAARAAGYDVNVPAPVPSTRVAPTFVGYPRGCTVPGTFDSGPCIPRGTCVLPEYICAREAGSINIWNYGGSGASGKYQAMPGTWGGYGGYQYAAWAPEWLQDEWATILWDGGRGASHWACC